MLVGATLEASPLTRRCCVRTKFLLAVLAFTALASALPSGPAGFGPGEQTAEAAFLGAPTITAIRFNPGSPATHTVFVRGTVATYPSGTKVDLYKADAQGEPEAFLGTAIIFNDGASAAGIVTVCGLASGDDVVGIATDPIGNSSGVSTTFAVGFGTSACPTPEFAISITTFIPGNNARAGVCLTDTRPPRFRFLHVRFDDRPFDPNSHAFRTRQKVTVIPDEAVDPDGLKEGSKAEDLTNPTRLYASDALDDGVIDDSDDDGVGNDCHLFDSEVGPVNKSMHIDDPIRLGPHRLSVRMHGQAGTGVFGFGFACPINWDFHVIIDDSGETTTASVVGWHDGFPAYEIYVNAQPVYQMPPIGGLNLLCGGTDVQVSRSVDLQE